MIRAWLDRILGDDKPKKKQIDDVLWMELRQRAAYARETGRHEITVTPDEWARLLEMPDLARPLRPLDSPARLFGLAIRIQND